MPMRRGVEKKDAILLLLAAGVGAYAVHANWDTLRVKLGLDDLRPGLIKAMRLAKDAHTFDPTTTNWVYLRDRANNGEITLKGDPWESTEVGALNYRVTCTFTENGEAKVHVFAADIGKNALTYQGLDQSTPAPR